MVEMVQFANDAADALMLVPFVVKPKMADCFVTVGRLYLII